MGRELVGLFGGRIEADGRVHPLAGLAEGHCRQTGIDAGTGGVDQALRREAFGQFQEIEEALYEAAYKVDLRDSAELGAANKILRF